MSSTKQQHDYKSPVYYTLPHILEKGCQYNMIIGERSNGKTYSSLEYGMRKFKENGEQMAYIRRWKEDCRGKRAQTLFDAIVANGLIEELTDNEFNCVKYQSGKWYFAKFDETLDRFVLANEPFCYFFSLSEMEHDKSTSYPKITTIVFDEFITRSVYLQDEFVLFMNVLSTIIRRRDNVKIFMLANTVNKYCPYFKEMGLGHVADMELGKIDIYTYGDTRLKVAVERCAPLDKSGKPSDLYFAFDNPSLSMITGGAWELAIYPHCPRKYKASDVIFSFFLDFNDTLLQGDVIQLSDCCFLYFHLKTTPIQNEDTDIIFSEVYDPRPNHFRNIRKGTTKLEQQIGQFFRMEKVFYQDNDVGEIVRNYLSVCTKSSI